MLTRILRPATLAPLFLAALALGSWTQAQTICVKTDQHCASKTAVVEIPDDGTVFCLIGSPIVKIYSKAACPSGGAGLVVLVRCGATSNGFSYSGSGVTHNIGIAGGANWEDVLNGSCADLTYSVN